MIAANLLVLGVIVLALTPGILKIHADRKKRKELPANVFPGCASCPLLDQCTAPAESCSSGYPNGSHNAPDNGHRNARGNTLRNDLRNNSSGGDRSDPGCSCG